MIKAIIFDADGMIVHGTRFSSRLAKKFNISTETTAEFFKGDFQQCLIGKADLKEELLAYFSSWGWKGSIDEFLEFWFSEEYNFIDERFFPLIQELRQNNLKCYLATNNEKYRTENLINKRGLGKYFDGVFSSAYLGSKKPELEFFESILEDLPNIKKEEILFWDDDAKNIEGAESFRLKSQMYADFTEFQKTLINFNTNLNDLA
jgi:putative hydrolase of the HAD superfamily